MKAVLLAAGRGNRLKPITNKIPKLMIKICGKPILEYVINDLVKCGFDEICLVIGHFGNQIKDYFKDGSKFNIRIHYIVQEKLTGTANALNCAKEFVKDDPFLLYLSDTIIPKDLSYHLKKMIDDKSEINILSAKIAKSDSGNVGNIEVNNDYVTKINEKPTKRKFELGWAGLAIFKSDFIFKIIENLVPSSTGEYEITEAMNECLSYDKTIRNNICDGFIDAGSPNGLLEMSKFILKNSFFSSKNSFKIENQTIIKPSYIGNNCIIGKNVTIGPFVSIGNNVKLGHNVTVAYSLILDGAEIESNKTILKSIIS